MKLKLDKQTTLKMIEKYYREQLDLDGTASAKTTLDWVGYGMSEHEDVVVEFKICGKMKLMDTEVDMEASVSIDEAKDAIKYCIEQEGFTYQSLELDIGTTPETTGYGLGEKTTKKPYFKGVNVNIKTKEKKLGGK